MDWKSVVRRFIADTRGATFMKLGRAPTMLMILSTVGFADTDCTPRELVSSRFELETHGHDLRGIGDVRVGVHIARLGNKLNNISGGMVIVVRKDFDYGSDVASAQSMFWKVDQQRH